MRLHEKYGKIVNALPGSPHASSKHRAFEHLASFSCVLAQELRSRRLFALALVPQESAILVRKIANSRHSGLNGMEAIAFARLKLLPDLVVALGIFLDEVCGFFEALVALVSQECKTRNRQDGILWGGVCTISNHLHKWRAITR